MSAATADDGKGQSGTTGSAARREAARAQTGRRGPVAGAGRIHRLPVGSGGRNGRSPASGLLVWGVLGPCPLVKAQRPTTMAPPPLLGGREVSAVVAITAAIVETRLLRAPATDRHRGELDVWKEGRRPCEPPWPPEAWSPERRAQTQGDMYSQSPKKYVPFHYRPSTLKLGRALARTRSSGLCDRPT